jgi:hypothetical protein
VRCHVCPDPITTDVVRFESVETDDGRCVWGPVAVHEQCRLLIRTPFDGRLGAGFVAIGDKRHVSAA